MSYGVTDAGFVVKPFSAIKASIEARVLEVLGDVDLSDTTLAGQLLQSFALEMAEYWQVLESVYDAGYLNTSRKTNLDAIAVVQGVVRKPATKAKGTVRFSRTTVSEISFTIPAGSRIANAEGAPVYQTTEEGILVAGQLHVDIPAECVTPGTIGNITTGIINHMIDPIAGIETVTNTSAMVDGTDAESDAMLRYRTRVPTTAAKATMIAMEQALSAVEGVVDALVIENTTNHTVTCYVLGGSDGALNAAIAATRPCGIIASLARPNPVPVAVTVTVLKVSTITTEEVTANVQAALVSFFGSLAISEDVAYSDIIRAIANVDGVENVNALTATDGTTTLDALGEVLAVPDNSIATKGTATISVV